MLLQKREDHHSCYQKTQVSITSRGTTGIQCYHYSVGKTVFANRARENISDFWDASQKNCSKFKKGFLQSKALDSSTAISKWCPKNESARGKVLKKLSAKTTWNLNWNWVWLMILSTSKENASTVTRRRQQKAVKRGWNSALIKPLKLAANATLSDWKRLTGESITLASLASPL